MRMLFGLVTVAALLVGCGNDAEIAAKKQELQKLEAQLKTLNKEMEAKSPGWQEVNNKLIPLKGQLDHAKGTDREAEVRARYDEATAASAEAIKAKNELRLRIQAIKDKVKALKEKIRFLGG